jgi:CheY-like chemotaxis protein
LAEVGWCRISQIKGKVPAPPNQDLFHQHSPSDRIKVVPSHHEYVPVPTRCPFAQSKLVAADEVTGRAFVDAFEDTPVVLMSEGGKTEDVMRAVRLGAVDYLDKPLSLLKLKNIWQHSVRKMMQRTTLYDAPGYNKNNSPAFSEPVPVPQQQTSYSNCLPSAMTAPICPQWGGRAPSHCAASMHKSPSVTDTAAQPFERSLPGATIKPEVAAAQAHLRDGYRSSVDSPGTPPGEDQEPVEAASSGSGSVLPKTSIDVPAVGDDVTRVSRASGTSIDAVDQTSTAAVAAAAAAAVVPTAAPHAARPAACLVKGNTTTAANSSGAAKWPQLGLGCVWGTPVGAQMPPSVAIPPPPSSSSSAMVGGTAQVPVPATTTAPLPLPATTNPMMVMHAPPLPPPAASALPTNATMATLPGMSSMSGPAPLLIKSRPMSLDSAIMQQQQQQHLGGLYAATAPAASAPPPLPEGFLSVNKGMGGMVSGGPLGLKLRKSRSLLDLINATLTAPPHA